MARVVCTLIVIILLAGKSEACSQPCYSEQENTNCRGDSGDLPSYTLHMAVHPHLDAFWIFDFESYYDPKPNQGSVMSYFSSNRFHSVKQIFDTTTNVLLESKKHRQANGPQSQKGHRSFFNSQMGFFKRWYTEQSESKKKQVKQLLGTKYWEIVGGGFVEQDEGCAYYEDMIENFQVGLRFLKENFNYYPRAAVAADSFGHSQSTLAMLAHMGVEGYFVERSDEHILLQNKTEFIWRAESANGMVYGALPTHIRWAIHGFEDQFGRGGSESQVICQTKSQFINNLHRETQFLKRILKSTHIMRYFGHDFQRFDDHDYHVMQGMMEQFSREKCRKVTAEYSNPTEYFQILMGEVFGNNVKPVVTRSEDIMPIWDYDSGLYWTGYYTTDPFHKKNYRDAGRYLYAARKAFLPAYIGEQTSQAHKSSYEALEQLAETVSYLQHHDGISGTSKYSVMDEYQSLAERNLKNVKKVVDEMFELEFPPNTNNPVFDCNMENQCSIPPGTTGDIYLKIFNTAGTINHHPIIVHLSEEDNFQPEVDYYEINCLCQEFPCPCDLYLFTKLPTYSLIRLKRVQNRKKDANLLQKLTGDEMLRYNSTHMLITINNKEYSIGYRRLNGDATPRRYDHLSRYGEQGPRSFNIRSGKYALGNDPKTEVTLSEIQAVYKLESDYVKKIIIRWKREQMKTIISIQNDQLNQWKVQTLSAAEGYKLSDLYLEVGSSIQNNQTFYTDSNGWLVMKRTLYHHEDYSAYFSKEGYDNIDGNSYPMTAFAYIQDTTDKVSVNTDRPQGVISYKPGTLWINFDRLSADDGKWVYETTYRNEYQKFTHYVTVQNKNNNEREIQKLYDQPLLIQGVEVPSNERVENYQFNRDVRDSWAQVSGIEHVKMTLKAWNDSTVLVRVQNLRDEEERQFQLFAGNVSPLLTTFYGNTIQFDQVQEMSLGGNMKYSEFLNRKWNWDSVVNLRKQNNIFNKKFQRIMTLKPLEIRTFLFHGLKIDEKCIDVNELQHDEQSITYEIDNYKDMPVRSGKEISEAIINYMKNGDHCNEKSPVLKEGMKNINYNDDSQSIPKESTPTSTQKPTVSKPNETPREKPDFFDIKPINTQPANTQAIDAEPVETKPTERISPLNPSLPGRRQNLEEDLSGEMVKMQIEKREKLTKQQKIRYFKQKLEKIKAQGSAPV